MISYIKYENLANKEFEENLEMIEPKENEAEEWQNIIKKKMKKLFNDMEKRLTFKIYPSKGKEFGGIFNHLNKEYNGNYAANFFLMSQVQVYFKVINMVKKGQYWTLDNELNGYLPFDFKDKRISLTHCSFKLKDQMI